MSGEISLLIKGNSGQLKKELAGASEAVKDFGNQSEKYMQKAGLSAKQLAFSTRGLPAQFTDIAVSLQAGQNPLTVFLQQGGQLKDMFGGLGPATKAMGGYIMGLINPYTIAAAAAAALGYAWYKGAAEAGEYSKALILSGNTAGATAAQMQAMARNISASSSASTGAAAEAVTQFVRNGDIASGKIQAFASTAVSMQQLTGVAVADTVKQFVELGKSPVDASLKLNETTGYLTVGVYEQIKALMDQGKTLEAAELAQKSYNDALIARIPQLKASLGTLENAWSAIAGKAKGAWDAMLNVGRPDAKSDIQAQITILEARLKDKTTGEITSGDSSYFGRTTRANINLLKDQLAYMGEAERLEKRTAEATGTRNKQLAASVSLSKEADQYASKQVQMQRAIAKAQENFEGSGKSAADLANYSQAVVGIQAKFKEAEKSVKGTRAALDDAARGVTLYNDLMAVSTGLSANFAEKQGLLAAKFGKDSNMDEYRAGLTALIAQQPYMVDSLKAEATALAEIAKARDKALLTHAEELESLGEKAQKLEDEVALYGMSKDAIETLTTARMLDQIEVLKGFDNSGDEIARIEQVIAARQRLAKAGTALDLKDASAKAADAMAADQKKAAEESGKYWEDALMRAFESGKGFFQSLWDTIKNTLKTQVLKVLIQGVGLGGMGASGAAIAGGADGGASLMGVASSLSGMYDAITGGFAKLGNTVGLKIGEFGSSLMNSSSSMVSELGAKLTANSAALGTAASYFGGIAAGLAAGKMISGGYSAFGGSGNTAVNVGTAIGAFFGPLGAAVGGAIGGLVNRAFGRKATELLSSGTRGTFSGDEFAGTNYANYQQKGGWFRSDKNWSVATAMAAETQDAWSTAFAGVKGSVAGMAASMGLATDKIAAYSKYVDIAAGTTEEALTALFTGMADDMASAAAPAIAQFARSGETASVTLGRLSGSLTTANAWLGVLDKTLLDLSLAGGDAASKLADTFGGLEAMAQASKTYYELFWSESERLADTAINVAKGLALVNVAMPSSKDAFRAVVDGLDLTTDAGRSTYAVMLALAPEFAQVADAAQASVKLLTDVFDKLQDKLLGLIDSIASERDAVAGARAGILGMEPKTAAQLQAEINAAKVGLPSEASLVGANAALWGANVQVENAQGRYDSASAKQVNTTALDAAKALLDAAKAATASAQAGADLYTGDFGGRFASYVAKGLSGVDMSGIWGPSGELNAVLAGLGLRNARAAEQPAQASYDAQLKAYNADAASENAEVTAYKAALVATQVAQAAATVAAKKAATDYAAAIQLYSGDAEKAVKVLSKLRDETVAYYEAQQAIANAMSASAETLREAVRSTKFGQLSSASALAQQQRDFSQNYSLALATSGAGKASYAGKLGAALPGLSTALMDTSSTRAEWALATAKLYAQSEAIAEQLASAATAMSYEAESISLLGSIDLALNELDTNTAILKNAIDAGSASQVSGLRAIVTQLGGVPAFASGGAHSGGARWVGENGPELEVTGPSRIYNASQLRGMGGNTARLEALVERQAQQLEAMSYELRAIAQTNAKLAKLAERAEHDGTLVRTDADQPLDIAA